MGALEDRVRSLGIEEKALANKAKREAKKAIEDDWKAKSATDKGKLTKAELIATLDKLSSQSSQLVSVQKSEFIGVMYD